MNSNSVIKLVVVFSYLSLLTVGGGMAAYPEMEALVVDTHAWLTREQLVHLYSIGQLAPGPNMMMVTSIGYLVAGFIGAVLTGLAFFGPTALLTLCVGRLWVRLKKWPWRQPIQRGLAPVSVGLLLAGCITIGMRAITSWVEVAIGTVVMLVLLKTKVNPLLMVACGAAVGVLFR